MFVRFHGVRGSIPTCDLRTWRYGGNTSCVEVETPAGHRIILDGGTGLRSLSRLPDWGSPSGPLHATWLISHYHWDHIQGLPFFSPLYNPRNHFEFFGLRPAGVGGMEGALQGQMLQPYFPVDISILVAARTFSVVDSGCRWQLGDAMVETAALNHPQGCLGFRIETELGTMVYASDTEPGDAVGDAAVRHLARGADVLIYDAQFSPAMLERRRGWGHSSWLEGVAVVRDAGTRCLILFHHDPDSDDASVDRFVLLARERWRQTWGASEGLQVTCRTPHVHVGSISPRIGPRVSARLPVLVRARRADGTTMEVEGVMANMTLKGTYVVVPETPALNSEVEIALVTEDGHGETTIGRVVRVDVDQETGKPGLGIAFATEDQGRRIVGDARQPVGELSSGQDPPERSDS